MKRDLYAEVTARIVAELEAGAAPWVKPWSASPGANTPCNAVSNRPYSGCNVVLLWMAQAAGYRTPRFLTFKQALESGGNVRKGEHGTKVYFMKQLQVRDKGADNETATRLVPMMRDYTVFNIDQCENLPDDISTAKPMRVRNPDTRDEIADALLNSTGVDIREGHGEAFYVPSRDFVSMPAFEAFKGADHFYNVAFHELTHWTAHKTRLDRDLKNRFGSRNYAAEELIAELGAAFLCAEFGFDGDIRSAGYIGPWVELLKADKRAFFTACSQASKAADYLRGLTPPLNGLSLQNVHDVIAGRTGAPPVLADCSLIAPADYLSILTSYVESGFIVLFVFTTSNAIEHVVTVFGHTRNSDEWHPQAIPGYSGPASAQFYRSSGWVDHFVIHDDNLGPYYTLSSRAFEVDKSITAHWIIGIHPQHQPELLPSYAENVSAVVLKGSLANFAGHGSGNWFNYLLKQPWTYVLRPILLSRDAYKSHLLASVGHDQTKVAPGELDVADKLPDWFWMVEFSLPSLFTGNRSKLGEVIVRSAVTGAQGPLDLVEAIRLPSVIAIKNATGQFDIHQIGLKAHSPFYTSRMHGNEW